MQILQLLRSGSKILKEKNDNVTFFRCGAYII